MKPTVSMNTARIYLVDDDTTNADLFASILRRAGYTHVSTFTDPHLALETAERQQPDLILLDLHMPQLDGVAFLDAVRQGQSSSDFVPILVLTADLTREALTNALEAGANDYIVKPAYSDELLLRVHNLLSIRWSHEHLKNTNTALSAELRTRARFDHDRAANHAQKLLTIQRIIKRGGPQIVFQPIVELATGAIVGVEALSRFGTEPRRTPDQWFADAATVGLGAELEVAAIEAALRRIEDLDPTWIVALNVSPDTIFTPEFQETINDRDMSRLSFEITEHRPIADYEALAAATGALQARGARICIDDAGAGYASLRHILKLNPDVIKLDITLTRDVDKDPAKRALADSLGRFATDIGAAITAEGIETEGELHTLRAVGIHYGQGFYIARPGAPETLRGAGHAPANATR